MKKNILSSFSLLLSILMLFGVFSSCTSTPQESEASSDSATFETEESSSVSQDGNDEENETREETVIDPSDVVYPVANNDHGTLIANANNLWGGVNVYYESGVRKDLSITNDSMTVSIHAAADGKTNINSIKNKSGASYIEDTMDVFVKMSDGKTYYSTASSTPISFDLYRFGMYYYELRAENQSFINKINEYAEFDLGVENANTTRYYEMSRPKLDSESGAVKTTMEGKSDPRIYYDHTSFSADEYNYIAVDVRVSSPDMSYQRSLTVFVWGSADHVNPLAEVSSAVANDGEFHTYYFKIDSSSKYAGSTVDQFRFDFNGIIGDTLEYKNVRAVKADTDGAPELRLCRYFHTFTDKNQQVIQVTAREDTDGIEEIGMITKLDLDKVNAVIVKDKNGLHSSIDGIDWDSAEYVAFDVKDAGIFGYILLPDGDLALMGTTRANDTSSGKLTVSIEDGEYVIAQSRAPKDGKLTVPTATDNAEIDNYVENFDNCADFYMGQRIYTDESHDFAEFIKAAELERSPLKTESITVDAENSTEASYLGYDALRGMYVFQVAGSNFNRPYYEEPNKHFNVRFTVSGDESDRNMYIMTTTTHGELQCAAILSESNLLLPINVEVGKNFSDGGQSQYDAKDEPWSEAYFPMYVKAGEEKTLSFLNLYMNWGRFPLKQISFIQLAPLYHLSTGVTETNCLLPWYSNMGSTRNLWTIPDHRPMSAPFWATQPNHTSGGDHLFLRYTDSEGKFYATEQKSNYISSYGPTYAEVTFNHLSDDGRIKVSYTHMEMPQTDENRAYYTMEYEILEDISFNDFKNDFYFYSMNAYANVEYEKIGYLDENNECKVIPTDIKPGRTRFYTLGDECPYFSYFQDSDNTLSKGYVNLSFLIKDAEFDLQEATETPKFVIRTLDRYIYLTLNYDEFTLRKGDTIKIRAIIMPWGSQESDYSLEDKNVRDVRENTLLKPLTAVPEEGCTAVESDFLPTVHVTDGVKAMFTLKGASGNSVVELTGLKHLGIPMVNEKVNGLTVRYNLSSQYYTDKSGFGQAYDGYSVKYAPDGTYSYSFVVDMSKGEDRTFTVLVLPMNQFKEEEEPEFDPNNAIYGEAGIVEGANLMLDAEALLKGASKTSANKAMDTSKSKVMTDPDGTTYFRFVAKDGNNEAWFMPYTVPANPIKTGKYLTIKYRLPSTNTTTSADGSKTTRFEIWTSTKSATPSGNCLNYYKDYLRADDIWKILVIDLSQMSNLTFEPAPNGDYYANYLRFDVFAEGYGDGSYIDIAYISFDDRAEDIFAYPENDGFDTVTYYDGRLLDVPVTETDFPAPKVVYEEDTENYDTPFDLYISAQTLAHLGSNTNEFGSVTLYKEDGFVRFNSHAVSKESDFVIYRNAEGSETGRYLMIKYRASSTLATYLQIYATTLEKSSFTNDNASTSLSNTNFVRNGEWQIAIIDLSTLTKEFTATDEKFGATLIRLDVFNDTIGTTAEYVDIAFVAMCDNLDVAITYDKSVKTALARLDKETTRIYVTATGEIYGGTAPSTPSLQKPQFYLDAAALAEKAAVGDSIGGATLSSDGTYTTVKNKVGSGDGFFFIAADNTKVGRYLMIRYRTESSDRWEWGVKSKGVSSYGWFYVDPIADGEWHTIIIDLSKTPDGSFLADEGDGAYYAAALRWDIMNVRSDSEKKVDLAFVTASDDLSALVAVSGKEDYLLYSYFDSAKVALSQRPVIFHLNSFGSNERLKAQRFYEPLVFNKDHSKYPEQGFINTSPSKAGYIYIGGWLGTTAEAEGIVFRVLDGNGEPLSDWAQLSADGAYPQFSLSNEQAVINAVKAQIPSAPAAYNFRGYADLNAFAGQTITLELALVIKDAPEADRYFKIITAEGVKVTN